MPGDPFKSVATGQRLEIPAAAYNAFLDAARHTRGQLHATDRDEADRFRQSGIVKVLNATGGDLNRFGILALGTPIVTPSDDLVEFQRQVTFRGQVPTGDTGARFAVLLEPLAVGAIGRAVVSGVALVHVTVDDEVPSEFASVAVGNTTTLSAGVAGPARILWLDPSGSTPRWAVVRLDDGEETVRFELAASLDCGGSATANRVVYQSGAWNATESTFTVYDSLELARACGCGRSSSSGSSSGSGEGETPSVPAGTRGVARRFVDSGLWEVVAIGVGCNAEGSSSDADSSSEEEFSASSDSSSSSDSSGSTSSADSSSEDSSSERSSSGSSSSGTGSSSATVSETDVRCEGGTLNVYRRAVTIELVEGALRITQDPWLFDHAAGCCQCRDDCGSSSDDGSSSDSCSSSSNDLSSSEEVLSSESPSGSSGEELSSVDASSNVENSSNSSGDTSSGEPSAFGNVGSSSSGSSSSVVDSGNSSGGGTSSDSASTIMPSWEPSLLTSGDGSWDTGSSSGDVSESSDSGGDSGSSDSDSGDSGSSSDAGDVGLVAVTVRDALGPIGELPVTCNGETHLTDPLGHTNFSVPHSVTTVSIGFVGAAAWTATWTGGSASGFGTTASFEVPCDGNTEVIVSVVK